MISLLVHFLNKWIAQVCQWNCTNGAGDRQIILDYVELCADAAGLGPSLVAQNMSEANTSLHKIWGERIT